jgi:hypothetical protein
VNALVGPLAVAATVVVIAAGAKLHDPAATAGALRATGLRVPASLVRVGAAAELAVGVGCLVSPAWPPRALLAASYVGFAAFVVVALRRDVPVATCGCVGRADSPPSVLHVALDGLAASAVTASIAAGTRSPLDAVASSPMARAVALVAMVALGGAAFLLAITRLPSLLALRAPTRS